MPRTILFELLHQDVDHALQGTQLVEGATLSLVAWAVLEDPGIGLRRQETMGRFWRLLQGVGRRMLARMGIIPLVHQFHKTKTIIGQTAAKGAWGMEIIV